MRERVNLVRQKIDLLIKRDSSESDYERTGTAIRHELQSLQKEIARDARHANQNGYAQFAPQVELLAKTMVY